MAKVTYVGADVHETSTSLHMLDENGKTIQKTVLRTVPEELAHMLGSRKGRVAVAAEESQHSRWFHDHVGPVVDELIICCPKSAKPDDEESKTDALDAENLARGLYDGTLKQIYHAPPVHSVLKELVRGYDDIVKDKTRTKNRIRGVFRTHGRWSQSASLFSTEGREEWIEWLFDKHAGAHQRVLWLYRDLDRLEEKHDQAKRTMIQCARRTDGWKWVRSIPGFGDVYTSQVLAWIGTPFRFRTDKQLNKYCGFAVVFDTSSQYDKELERHDRVKTKGLNQSYHRPLKAVFKNAADACLKHRDTYQDIAAYYERRARKVGDEIARVDIARKLVTIVLTVWKRKEEYDPDKAVWTA